MHIISRNIRYNIIIQISDDTSNPIKLHANILKKLDKCNHSGNIIIAL